MAWTLPPPPSMLYYPTTGIILPALPSASLSFASSHMLSIDALYNAPLHSPRPPPSPPPPPTRGEIAAAAARAESKLKSAADVFGIRAADAGTYGISGTSGNNSSNSVMLGAAVGVAGEASAQCPPGGTPGEARGLRGSPTIVPSVAPAAGPVAFPDAFDMKMRGGPGFGWSNLAAWRLERIQSIQRDFAAGIPFPGRRQSSRNHSEVERPSASHAVGGQEDAGYSEAARQRAALKEPKNQLLLRQALLAQPAGRALMRRLACASPLLWPRFCDSFERDLLAFDRRVFPEAHKCQPAVTASKHDSKSFPAHNKLGKALEKLLGKDLEKQLVEKRVEKPLQMDVSRFPSGLIASPGDPLCTSSGGVGVGVSCAECEHTTPLERMLECKLSEVLFAHDGAGVSNAELAHAGYYGPRASSALAPSAQIMHALASIVIQQQKTIQLLSTVAKPKDFTSSTPSATNCASAPCQSAPNSFPASISTPSPMLFRGS